VRKFSILLKSLIAVIAVLVIAACSPLQQFLSEIRGGEATQEEDDSLEFQAYEYRLGLMRAQNWKFRALRGMVEEGVEVDEVIFTEYSHDLAALSGMLTEGFIPGSNVSNSRALPDIWTDWDGFLQKVGDLEAATAELAQQAATSGSAAAGTSVQSVGSACGGCHRSYRVY